MKKTAALLLLVCIMTGLFAQNEASKNFVKGTSLLVQKGSSLDKFPKLEIGFMGRKNADNEPGAYFFMRLQSTMETAGGIITDCKFAGSIGSDTDGWDAFQKFAYLALFIEMADDENKENPVILDLDLGELVLTDFQWYMNENQWRYTYDKTCVIKAKAITVEDEVRLYFYRTERLRDYRNSFESFNMPNDVYLTAAQCRKFFDAYGSKGSYVWKAIDIAIDAANRTIR